MHFELSLFTRYSWACDFDRFVIQVFVFCWFVLVGSIGRSTDYELSSGEMDQNQELATVGLYRLPLNLNHVWFQTAFTVFFFYSLDFVVYRLFMYSI